VYVYSVKFQRDAFVWF